MGGDIYSQNHEYMSTFVFVLFIERAYLRIRQGCEREREAGRERGEHGARKRRSGQERKESIGLRPKIEIRDTRGCCLAFARFVNGVECFHSSGVKRSVVNSTSDSFVSRVIIEQCKPTALFRVLWLLKS